MKKLKLYFLPIFCLIFLAIGLFFIAIRQQEISNYIFMISIIGAGIPLIYGTVKEFLGGKFNADIIAVISIIGSLITQEYLAGAIIVLMLSGGEALEKFAEQKAKGSLKKLLMIAPKIAHKKEEKNNDNFTDVKVEELQIRDYILIKPGEVVPVDCLIISGQGSVDQSNLTGESIPIEKTKGHELLSGTINLDGVITALVTKELKDSAFSQIVKLVADAENHKAKINRLADRYGSIFTPFVIIFAIITYIVSRDLNLTYSVFVVATPCPLILATPIAIISGIAKSAKKGVIVKNGSALESIALSNALIFDKTGTLTNGKPQVLESISLNKEYSSEDVINYAATLNKYSTHILSQSIIEASDKEKILEINVENFQDILGKGLIGEIDNMKYGVGSLSFLKNLDIEITNELKEIKNKANSDGNIISFIAKKGELIGYILIADKIRNDAKELILELRNLGIKKMVLATGDVKIIADKIANEVGIKTVYSETKPEDKAEIVNDLNKSGYTVAMIGDGVNDAPAMALANVGIAIGARGSTIASETSDIIIITNNIINLIPVIKVSRYSLKIAKQGIIFGMGFSVIGMFLASTGYLPPTLGAVSQELIDIIVIFNALRVLTFSDTVKNVTS